MNRRSRSVALTKLTTREALSAPHDRRSHWRAQRTETLFMQLRVRVPGGEERRTLRCESADLSRGGLRIAVATAVPVGSLIEAWIKVQGEPRNFYLVGQVRWCTAQDEGVEIGVALKDAPGTDYKGWRRVNFGAKTASSLADAQSSI